MAVTAAMTLSAASCKAEQKVTATCTVSNSGAAALYVGYIQPSLTPHGGTVQSVSSAVGVPAVGGAFAVTVAASGSTAFSFDVVPHAPASGYGNAEPASLVYDVGALIGMSDGSLVAASSTTLTVTPPSLT